MTATITSSRPLKRNCKSQQIFKEILLGLVFVSILFIFFNFLLTHFLFRTSFESRSAEIVLMGVVGEEDDVVYGVVIRDPRLGPFGRRRIPQHQTKLHTEDNHTSKKYKGEFKDYMK